MERFRKLMRLGKLLARDTRGVTAIEYVVIIAGVAVFVVISWTFLGTQLGDKFTTIAGALSGSGTTAVDSADTGGATETASSSNDNDSDFDDDSTS
ncbi:MAG: Flp family type IVb pilin [Rhodospirillales bacterium]